MVETHSSRVRRRQAGERCYDCGKPSHGMWRCELCRERVNNYRRERGMSYKKKDS